MTLIRGSGCSWLVFAVLLGMVASPVVADDINRPVFARPATTVDAFLLEGFLETFDGLDLQEAVALDGWTAGLDFTFAFRPGMQFRFLLPVRTEAEGVFVSNGEETDIEGWGGTFDFASLFFEHQLIGVDDNGPNRFGWFIGIGNRTANLETGTPDRYNHQGRSFHLGVRYDRRLQQLGTLFLDTEFRYYDPSDDLNPGDLLDDTFWLGTVTAAWLLPSRGALTGGVELINEFGEDWYAASLAPEIILAGSEKLDLKLAVPIGLSSDAPNWGTQFRLTLAL